MSRIRNPGILVVLLLFWLPSIAGEDTLELPLEVSIYSNSPTLPLQGQPFTSPIHPGIEMGSSFPFKKGEKNIFEWTLSLGYFHQRMAHHGVQLHPGIRHHHLSDLGLGWRTRFSIGYMHLFPEVAKFVQNNNGEYVRTGKWGRPQFMVSLSTGPTYQLKNSTLFLSYRIWAQMPFVNEYVPILPNTAIHLGIKIPFIHKSGQE